jgi:hypothetical protein
MRNVSDKRSGDNHAPSHSKTPQPAVRRCPVPGPEQKFSVQYIYIYIFFFPENLAVYEVMWKNMVESDRPQMIV